MTSGSTERLVQGSWSSVGPTESKRPPLRTSENLCGGPRPSVRAPWLPNGHLHTRFIGFSFFHFQRFLLYFILLSRQCSSGDVWDNYLAFMGLWLFLKYPTFLSSVPGELEAPPGGRVQERVEPWQVGEDCSSQN